MLKSCSLRQRFVRSSDAGGGHPLGGLAGPDVPRRLGVVAAALLLGTALPLPAQTIAAGTVFRDCRNCPQMVVVPAGEFAMGADAAEHQRFGVAADHAATEAPVHRVRIARPFAVGRFAVTRDEWANFARAAPAAAAGAHLATPAGAAGANAGADARSDVGTATAVADRGCGALTPATGAWADDASRSWRNPGFRQTGRHPVVCVSWGEAKAYADWLSRITGKAYRLLSEAEWEYAARAGTTTANYWGADRELACRHANASDLTRAERHAYARSVPDSSFLCHDGHVFTAPVDAFPPNPFGLYGMSGNVWQWVEDCFNATHDGAPDDGSPRRDGDCSHRVDRGASWVNSPRYVRAAARHKDLVDARTSVLGLRLAREL